MKKIITILFVVLSVFCYSQTSIDISIRKKPFKIENYTICVGNEDEEVYFSCLEYLETSSNIKIISVCASQHIIGFRTTYRNFGVVSGVLNHEFPDMIFFKTDEIIICNE